MVMSSINALVGGWIVPETIFSYLEVFSADFTMRFIAAENNTTDIVHQVTMPISCLCQSRVIALEENLNVKPSK